jgi:DNA-binding transcriptional ArsR family regulator
MQRDDANADVYGADDEATDLIFHALSNRTRRRMLDLIRAQPGCIVAGVADVFDISRIGVLKHLQVLEDAGLVVSLKEGRERRLYANAAPIQMIYERWTTELDRYWAGTLTGLKRIVETRSANVRKGRNAWNKTTTKSSASSSKARSGGSGKS